MTSSQSDTNMQLSKPGRTHGLTGARTADPAADTADLGSVRARMRHAYAEYDADHVELLSSSLAGATHLAATRKGLYAINETEWSQITQGFYFGLTLRGNEIFAFEACDIPHSPLRKGRLVRLVRDGDRVVQSSVAGKGLDSGCHQIDFCGGRLHVVDTYNQQVVRFHAHEADWETLSPLPTPPHGRWANTDPRYVHANSVLKVGKAFLLLLHNSSEHSGRQSEVAIFDEDWSPAGRLPLDGRSCHGLALLEDGTLLTCDSKAGDLISASGFRAPISSFLTRGLAVGREDIAVGSSILAKREERLLSSGKVTFLDRDFRERAVLDLPGAPTELRRLDGEDYGLSDFLSRQPWGRKLNSTQASSRLEI